MTRTFLHGFESAAASPITGTTVHWEVSDIEDTGIREVLPRIYAKFTSAGE